MTYPCENEGDPGQPVVFQTHFPTATGRGKFVPADLIPAAERPDGEYPMVLITGRQLEHWHTGAMTRRSGALDAIEPEPVASLHPLICGAEGRPGEVVTVESRRGRISLYARDAGTPRGAVFIPFCYYEAAANLLTNPVLDPFGKIPEFKYCAVKVLKGGARPGDPGYGKGRTLRSFTGKGACTSNHNKMKILVAVDGSKPSLKAVQLLVEHCDWYRSPPRWSRYGAPAGASCRAWARRSARPDRAYYVEEGEAMLASARRKLDAAGVPYTVARPGRPVAEAIVKHAKDKHCDLIYIGTHGSSAIGKALIGSTATKVLHISDVPVLLVK